MTLSVSMLIRPSFTFTAKHKPNKYKLKSMKQVPENSHVTLSCTEVIPNSDLKWFKEEKLLNSLFRLVKKMY